MAETLIRICTKDIIEMMFAYIKEKYPGRSISFKNFNTFRTSIGEFELDHIEKESGKESYEISHEPNKCWDVEKEDLKHENDLNNIINLCELMIQSRKHKNGN